MPPRSAHRPMRPSSASISRTRCPLPSPPNAGLQDIAPTVEKRCVTRAVWAPQRAAAAAASQPACPPPTTTTSNPSMPTVLHAPCPSAKRPGLFHVKRLLPDAEIAEDRLQHVLDVDPADEPTHRCRGAAQV